MGLGKTGTHKSTFKWRVMLLWWYSATQEASRATPEISSCTTLNKHHSSLQKDHSPLEAHGVSGVERDVIFFGAHDVFVVTHKMFIAWRVMFH